MKKVGKTTRPFRYDLNQITYDYTVELTDRFKGLDLIDRVPKELWMVVHDFVQEEVIKTKIKIKMYQDHPQGKEVQKGKMVVQGGLKNS